jgi:hypothetical protein
MFEMSHRLRLMCATLAGAVLCLTMAGAAFAQGVVDWREIVTEDAWLQHQCRVTYLSHIVERETKSGRIVMVKVHCDDNRSFDAVQSGADQPFTFSECTPRDTKTC